MSTQTETSSIPMPRESGPPEFTAFSRLCSIPLIQSSLSVISETLASNVYTKSPYTTAKGMSTTAYKYTEPIQLRFAPLIVRADTLANKSLDVVADKYPAAFTTTDEDVVRVYRERRASASKAIDERVTKPAVQVAQGIDQQFTPIVDYVNARINPDSQPSSPTEGPKYQYQRALALSKQMYGLSAVQVRQFQENSTLVKKATETSQSISALASSSINDTKTRINGISQTLLGELERLQASSSKIAHDATSQIQSRIPPATQEMFNDAAQELGKVMSNMRSIMAEKDVPVQDKVTKMSREVSDKLAPVLTSLKTQLAEMLPRRAQSAPPSPMVNGNGHAQ